eukprot:4046239-Ditylum_brightwellii.AAC.1
MSHLLVAVIPFTSNVTIVEGNTVGDDVGCRDDGGSVRKAPAAASASQLSWAGRLSSAESVSSS